MLSPLVLSLLLPVAASAQPASGPVPVKPGQTVRIGFHYNLERDCAPLDYPEIRIEAGPDQGRITTRKVQERPRFNPESLWVHCNARPVWGTEVRYTANRNAAGEDAVRVLILYGGSARTITYRVTITP